MNTLPELLALEKIIELGAPHLQVQVVRQVQLASGHSFPTSTPSTSAQATCAKREVRTMRATRRGSDGTDCGTGTPCGGR